MKSYIKQLLREGLISEKIANIDIDVNMLYDVYFKDDIDEIGRTGVITDDMFKMKQTNTSILKDDESLVANENNKCNMIN
jgi:flagellar basal body rod protein FlgB